MINLQPWELHVETVATVYREMGLPEPFVFVQREPAPNDAEIAGMVTGFIRNEQGHKYLDVDHMIVRPGASRKLTTMMQMSEGATQLAFANGCAYVLISVFLNDARLSGLSAWAKRMKFKPWADSDDSRWFIRHNPHYVYESETHGQGREGSISEASSGGSRPERG